MKTLRLEFHPRGARMSPLAAWLALGVAALAASATGWSLARRDDALEALQARRELLQARVHPPAPRAEVVGPVLARRIASANQAIDALAVPWLLLLQSLESADARGLGVMSLAPNARTHQLRLSGEAKSVPDLLAYVDRLAALRTLEQVHLEGYETVQRDGVDVVSFTVAATWRTN